MTQIYLLRHGQTDWNLQGRWQGHADIPLNAVGLEQAVRLAQTLSACGLQAIYASDLQRARQTAEALAQVTGLSVVVDARLREVNQGEWQGLPMAEIRQRYRRGYQDLKDPTLFAPPGGESLRQLCDRLLSSIQEIAIHHPDQRVAVVSHGFAVAVLLAHFQELPLMQAWEMIPRNEEWHVLQINR